MAQTLTATVYSSPMSPLSMYSPSSTEVESSPYSPSSSSVASTKTSNSGLARTIRPLKQWFKRSQHCSPQSTHVIATATPKKPLAPLDLYTGPSSTLLPSPVTSPMLKPLLIRHVPMGYIHSRFGQSEKLLGSGTGGSVYLHRPHDDPHREFAVKVFSPLSIMASSTGIAGQKQQPQPLTSAVSPVIVQRLLDEAAIGRSLIHPNIIRTLDYVREADGTHYSVMEYCPVDMFDMVESGALTSTDIDCYFAQLLHGLHHMHSQGVAHRDLKLDNVCLTHDGQVKIIDFGCATTFDPLNPATTGMCGSDPYIAPEVFTNEPYDPRKADVWALAVILLSMLSNHFPWEVARTTDPNFRMYLRYKDAIVDHWMATKPEAAATVKRMLSLNPLERPTTEELLADPWIRSIAMCMDYPLEHFPTHYHMASCPMMVGSPASMVSDFSSDFGVATDSYPSHSHYVPTPRH
ncbi:serine/threonine protein kinase [Dispira simplex]|nr:serine/threonine protein kinase [Dispira simplex]